MTTLLVTLAQRPADAGAVYEYLLTSDGTVVLEHSSAALSLLPARAGDTVAVVPLSALSWHPVHWPKEARSGRWLKERNPARLRAMLDGVLEEQLLDDPAQLHLALGPHSAGDATPWVAVCDKAWLLAAVQALEQSGRVVRRIVPELAPDSLTDLLWVMGEPDAPRMVFVRYGVLCHWPLTSASVELAHWGTDLPIYAEPALASRAEALFARKVTLQTAAQRRLQALESAWDLAQFDLARSGGTRLQERLWKALRSWMRAPQWRGARLALAAALLINLVGFNAWAWRERSEIAAQRARIHRILTDTFKQVQVVVDAPVQMAKELALLRQSSGTLSGRDLEVMLSALGSARGGEVPLAIDYANGELRLKGPAPQGDDLANLETRLGALGYMVQVESDRLILRYGERP